MKKPPKAAIATPQIAAGRGCRSTRPTEIGVGAACGREDPSPGLEAAWVIPPAHRRYRLSAAIGKLSSRCSKMTLDHADATTPVTNLDSRPALRADGSPSNEPRSWAHAGAGAERRAATQRPVCWPLDRRS